jgi:hypothetical protein
MHGNLVRDRASEFTLVSLSQHNLNTVPVCLTEEFTDDPPADEILIIFREAAFGAVASDGIAAGTRLLDPDTRRYYGSGEAVEYGRNTGLLWFISADGGVHANAVDREVFRGSV